MGLDMGKKHERVIEVEAKERKQGLWINTSGLNRQSV